MPNKNVETLAGPTAMVSACSDEGFGMPLIEGSIQAYHS